jgi:hypothetical protein
MRRCPFDGGPCAMPACETDCDYMLLIARKPKYWKLNPKPTVCEVIVQNCLKFSNAFIRVFTRCLPLNLP